MSIKIPEDLRGVLKVEEIGDCIAVSAYNVYCAFFRGPDRKASATQALRLVVHLADCERSAEHQIIEERASRPAFEKMLKLVKK